MNPDFTVRPNPRPTDPSGPDHSTRTQQNSQEEIQKRESMAKEAAARMQEASSATSINMLPTSSPLELSQDFVGVMDQIYQEAYTPQHADSEPNAQNPLFREMNQKMVQELKRDIQIIREFIREAGYLVNEQHLPITQVVLSLKAMQGGMLWQQFQQAVQKSIFFQGLGSANPPESAKVGNKTLESMNPQIKAKTELEDLGFKKPGQAFLELIQAEMNPKGEIDHFLAALKILDREGLKKSSRKLLAYLKKRGGMPQEYLLPYQKRDGEVFAPFLQRDEIQRVNFWYILLALAAFAASIGFGLNFVEASLVGLGMIVLMGILAFLFKSR